tara:strand:- start:18097 stop:18486 length:390 start_codon:yes stop_codon:yes gene_type:complete
LEIKPHKIEEYQFIRSYDSNGFLVSGVNFTGPILISKEQTFNWNFKNKIETMTFSDVSKINEIQDIDVLLIGTGKTFKMISNDFRAALRSNGIGVESMDTPAACRTYNVLITEARGVVGAILPNSSIIQ